jgi:hypothetical protein
MKVLRRRDLWRNATKYFRGAGVGHKQDVLVQKKKTFF